MNAYSLTYAPFLLLLLLGALVEIRYWIRNRARMTPKARLRRGLFLAAVPVLCAALWLGWERRAFPELGGSCCPIGYLPASPPKKRVLRLPSGTPFIYLKSF